MVKYELNLIDQQDSLLFSEWKFRVKRSQSVGALTHFVNSLTDGGFFVTAMEFEKTGALICVEVSSKDKPNWLNWLKKNNVPLIRRIK